MKEYKLHDAGSVRGRERIAEKVLLTRMPGGAAFDPRRAFNTRVLLHSLQPRLEISFSPTFIPPPSLSSSTLTDVLPFDLLSRATSFLSPLFFFLFPLVSSPFHGHRTTKRRKSDVLRWHAPISSLVNARPPLLRFLISVVFRLRLARVRFLFLSVFVIATSRCSSLFFFSLVTPFFHPPFLRLCVSRLANGPASQVSR